MLGKLAVRNMRRMSKDYLVYVLTMMITAALMYAFNSLMFETEIAGRFELESMMFMMLVMASVFIVLIVAWLIHYMVRFMLEKRSSEFGIYLLLGMRKKTISRLYMRENLLLGMGALLVGFGFGILVQQVLMSALYSMMREEYQLKVQFNKNTILTTVLCFGGCYLLALFRCRRKFKKMNIHDLMEAKRQNEEIKEKYVGVKQIFFPLSVVMLLAFWTVFEMLRSAGQITAFLIGLVLTIYLFYMGLSAWIVCFIRKKHNGIYRSQRLFLLRQFSSKIRSMQFTMGTLTALFTVALLGASVAFMFSDYENTVLQDKFPFDVQIYSADAEDDFADELKILHESTEVTDSFIYRIYTDMGQQVNAWMYTNLEAFGTMYRLEDGSPDMEKIKQQLESDSTYCQYDTYMSVSDYNRLRTMLGYDPIQLKENAYAVHIKARLREQVQDIAKELHIDGAPECAGIYSEPFSQDGHNGGDYLIIVPDSKIQEMYPYYAELAADIKGKAPEGLERKLDGITKEEERDFGGHAVPELEKNSCIGSDNIIVYNATNLVRDNLIPEVKYMLASLIMPMFYIGLVFVCVAVTVLAVQQLSDSAKYKFRYDVLHKMGFERREIRSMIRKQLAAFYLCPALLAMIISGKMVLFLSGQFVKETGVPTASGSYFAEACALFFGIYLVYFAVTYVGFVRNVERG